MFKDHPPHFIENLSVYLDKHENSLIPLQHIEDAINNTFDPFVTVIKDLEVGGKTK